MTSPKPRRKSVLLFVADQLRADHLGCYGNAQIRTPAIDSLAARGVVFTNYHAANPICMPNRASMLTGRMPSVHGVRRNGIPLPMAERTFVQTLKESGYRTALVGKAHFQPYGVGRIEPPDSALARSDPHWPHGYRQEDLARWRKEPRPLSGAYYGFDDVAMCLYHGDAVGGDYAAWLEKAHPGSAALIGPGNALPPDGRHCRDAWRTRVPEELYSTSYISEQACQWLAAHARQGDDDRAPFFLMCSFPDPHHPFTPPGKYWDMYDPDAVRLPATFDRASEHPLIQHIHRVSGAGQALPSNHHPFAPDAREARTAIALTYGLISLLDRAVGDICRTLQTLGLADDTVIGFTSDHGDMMGDHGVFLKGPMHFRGLTRVPMIWVDPQGGGTASRIEATRSTVDLAPTILDAAGLTPHLGCQGRSWLADLGASAPDDEYRLIETESATLTFGRPAPFKLRTIVNSRWRLTRSADDGLCELHDVRADPGESVNLWNDAGFQDIRRELSDILLARVMDAADTSPPPLASG